MDKKTLYSILINGHFLPAEAKRIINSTKNQFSSEGQDLDKLWQSGLIQKAIRSRNATVANMRSAGFSDKQIAGSISAWYRGRATDSSVFSFLRAEYQVKSKEISSYKLAVRLRARKQVNQLTKGTGLPYGKRVARPSRSTLNVRPQDKFPTF